MITMMTMMTMRFGESSYVIRVPTVLRLSGTRACVRALRVPFVDNDFRDNSDKQVPADVVKL